MRSGDTIAVRHEPMTRGHVERLAPMVADLLEESDTLVTDLDGIAVTTGPGSFTGARLGVAFARGLSLAAGVPVTGISVFEAIAATWEESVMVALPGKNGALMLQGFKGSRAIAPAGEYLPDQISAALPDSPFSIIGPASSAVYDALAESAQDYHAVCADWPPLTAEAVARAALPAFAANTVTVPAPLYLRAPDAKPQAQITSAL